MGLFDGLKEILKGGGGGTRESVSPLLVRPIDTPIPMGTSDVAKMPILPMHFKFMYDLYYYSDVLRTVIKALVWELFRNGIEIKRKFAVKCITCGTEYDEYVDTCEVCGSKKLREPIYKERQKLEKLLSDANLNDQSLVDVLMDSAVDVAVTDNGFLVVIKKYEFNENGDIVYAEPVEIIRGSPLKMKLIMNEHGRLGMTDDGQVVGICLNHRDKYKLFRQEELESARCPYCGARMFPAYYKLDAGSEIIYYTDGEVLHYKLFTTGVGYGLSPILSIWIKVMILMKMDWFVLMAYHLQRPPKGLLILRGNRESLAKAWEWLVEQARVHPHMISPLIVEGGQESGTRRVAEFIDLTVRSQDIDFISYREELRKAIGAVYGVMPLWQGDTRGGLANEGLQITVTNRAVELWHRLYNDKVLPWLLRQLGISDWKLELRPHEIRDELSKLEVAIRKTQLAQALQSLGYKAILTESKDEVVEFKFEEKNAEEQLREMLEQIIAQTKAQVTVDELMNTIFSKLQQQSEEEGVEGNGGVGKLGTVGEILGLQENKGNEEIENVQSNELARAEGEPEAMRPRRTEQRMEGEPQMPRR